MLLCRPLEGCFKGDKDEEGKNRILVVEPKSPNEGDAHRDSGVRDSDDHEPACDDAEAHQRSRPLPAAGAPNRRQGRSSAGHHSGAASGRCVTASSPPHDLRIGQIGLPCVRVSACAAAVISRAVHGLSQRRHRIS